MHYAGFPSGPDGWIVAFGDMVGAHLWHRFRYLEKFPQIGIHNLKFMHGIVQYAAFLNVICRRRRTCNLLDHRRRYQRNAIIMVAYSEP